MAEMRRLSTSARNAETPKAFMQNRGTSGRPAIPSFAAKCLGAAAAAPCHHCPDKAELASRRLAPGRFALLSLAFIITLTVTAQAAGLSVTHLRCEYAENPLGVDLPHPRLSWELTSAARGQRQTACRILVASSLKTLARDHGDLWDSGIVDTNETLHLPYQGRPLKSSQPVFWKVRAWDKDGQASAWSRPASWTMGLLEAANPPLSGNLEVPGWQAHWISAAGATVPSRPLLGSKSRPAYQTMRLRGEIAVKPGLRRAVMHVCGLGHYELTINGRPVGEDLLAPGWTKYDRTCLYDTREVAPLLRPGPNVIGLLLGNGMYNVKSGRYTKFTGSFGPLKAIAQLQLEYADGTREIVGTDQRWRVSPGPITFSSIFGGEDYDARLESPGWNRPKYDDSSWEPALVVSGPGGQLKGHGSAAPPLRAFEVLRPASIRELKPGVAVYDLGQNAPLMPRLKVKGPPGSTVTITPAELLHPDGSVDRESCGGGEAYWKYTLAGGSRETWFPKFFYHGGRYLQVERAPAPAGLELPVVESLEGVVVHTSSRPVGQFACSSGLFNRIHTLIRWAQRANLMHLVTDCPHRERLGWLEQYHLNGPSLRYEFDLAQLFVKGMSDMADSQLANGLVPDIAPEYTVFDGGFRDSPEWGSALVVVPWQQYEWTGDLDLLRRHYDGMRRYVAYLGSRATNQIVSHGLGDWYDIGPKPPGYAQLTPIPLTATAFYYYDAWIMAQAAVLLGRAEDASRYEALAARIRAGYNGTFFNPETGQYAAGSQCANAISLVMNLCEPAQRAAVLDALVKDIRDRGNALTAGDVGYRYLLRALADGSRSDVIFDLNHQSEKPGYGYQLKQGATSLTEAWDARRSSSQNHFMLGHIVEWFYRDVAGIGCDPTGPGFKRIIIYPQPVGDLTWARAAYDSIRGRIVSDWKRADGNLVLKVTIPANTTATVFLPARPEYPVTEGRVPAEHSQGVKFLRREHDRAVFEIGSGRYEFQSRF